MPATHEPYQFGNIRQLEAAEIQAEADGDEFEQITNNFGFPELGFYEKGSWFPVCSQCHCHKLPNRGQGMLCSDCEHDFDLECERDNDVDFSLGWDTVVTADERYKHTMRREFLEDKALDGVTFKATTTPRFSDVGEFGYSATWVVHGLGRRAQEVTLLNSADYVDPSDFDERSVYNVAKVAKAKGWKRVVARHTWYNGRRSIMILNVAQWNAFQLDGLFIPM